MRQLIHSAFIDNVLKGLEGITLGAVIFFAGALMMAAISTNGLDGRPNPLPHQLLG